MLRAIITKWKQFAELFLINKSPREPRLSATVRWDKTKRSNRDYSVKHIDATLLFIDDFIDATLILIQRQRCLSTAVPLPVIHKIIFWLQINLFSPPVIRRLKGEVLLFMLYIKALTPLVRLCSESAWNSTEQYTYNFIFFSCQNNLLSLC